MGAINTIPAVLIHRILNGGGLSGVAPVGSPLVDSGETIRRGRYRKYSDLTDGGLIDIAEAIAHEGFTVQRVYVSMPGVTGIDLFVVDRDGDDSFVGNITLTAGNGYAEWEAPGIFIPPGCQFKAKSLQALTADGQLVFILGNGWDIAVFDEFPSLGRDNRPPGMDRP